VTIQDQIMKLLKQLSRDLSMSMILVTHDLGVIAQMCDRVAVMYAGIIVEMCDVVSLFSGPRHPYTYGLMRSLPDASKPREELEAIPGSPPNLSDLPPGCPFAPRCRYAEPPCQEARPDLVEIAPGHLTRCRRRDLVATFEGLGKTGAVEAAL